MICEVNLSTCNAKITKCLLGAAGAHFLEFADNMVCN